METDILEQLYRQYYHSAYLYVLSLCHSRSLAEDIVQDAFVKAFLSLEKEQAEFRFWLLRVCKNLWIDRLRKDKRLSAYSIDEIHGCGFGENAEVPLLKGEQNRILYESIVRLGEPYREVLVLFYFSQFRMERIAAFLHISIPNVKTILHRARKKLKKELEGSGYDF